MLIGNLKERITGDARALARHHNSSYAINVLGFFFFCFNAITAAVHVSRSARLEACECVCVLVYITK